MPKWKQQNEKKQYGLFWSRDWLWDQILSSRQLQGKILDTVQKQNQPTNQPNKAKLWCSLWGQTDCGIALPFLLQMVESRKQPPVALSLSFDIFLPVLYHDLPIPTKMCKCSVHVLDAAFENCHVFKVRGFLSLVIVWGLIRTKKYAIWELE